MRANARQLLGGVGAFGLRWAPDIAFMRQHDHGIRAAWTAVPRSIKQRVEIATYQESGHVHKTGRIELALKAEPDVLASRIRLAAAIEL